MKQNQEIKRIFKFQNSTSNKIKSRESIWLEFKESFNWNSKDKYAKSIAAFANSKGGFIVFGIKNNPRELVGLKNNNFENFDEAKITEYLNSVFSPEILFEKYVQEIRGKTSGLLRIYEAMNKPVVCIKTAGDIREAEIYYRYNARSEKIKYPELKNLIGHIRDQERKSWMELMKRISKADPSSVFVQSKGTLKSDRSTSVRITEDPNAPALRVEEESILKEYPLDYESLTERLRDRYSDFKQNQKYHKLRYELKNNGKLCRTRYLDPENPKSTKKDFYHLKILKEFDKHYKIKKENK